MFRICTMWSSTNPECSGPSPIPVLTTCLRMGSAFMEGFSGLRKGTWSKEEDDLLRACIHLYGEGKWHLVPKRSGLRRCRKSCRLRWLNYLNPNIKRETFGEDEIDMMIRMRRLLGNRWSLIAGRLPGRTPNDVKNFWNTSMRKNKVYSQQDDNNEKAKEIARTHVVIKPQARTFSKNSPWLRGKLPTATSNQPESAKHSSSSSQVSDVGAALASPQSPENWLEGLLEDPEGDITYSLSGLDSILINDLWDDGEVTGMTTDNNDFPMEDPIDCSDFLALETDLL